MKTEQASLLKVLIYLSIKPRFGFYFIYLAGPSMARDVEEEIAENRPRKNPNTTIQPSQRFKGDPLWRRTIPLLLLHPLSTRPCKMGCNQIPQQIRFFLPVVMKWCDPTAFEYHPLSSALIKEIWKHEFKIMVKIPWIISRKHLRRVREKRKVLIPHNIKSKYHEDQKFLTLPAKS